MKFIRIVLALTLAASLSSCSTLMKGEYEELNIKTQPAGAVVTAGSEICHTPCTMELERGQDYQLKIEKKGYQIIQKDINGRSWDPYLWGNIVFLYAMPIAVAVDFYTGKVYDFKPKKMKLKLKPIK